MIARTGGNFFLLLFVVPKHLGPVVQPGNAVFARYSTILVGAVALLKETQQENVILGISTLNA